MAQIPSSSGGHPGFYHHDDPNARLRAASHLSTKAAIRHQLFDGELLDGIYQGHPPGVRFLAMTNRRLILLETTTQPGRLAVTSTPLTRVTSVGLIPTHDTDIEEGTILVIRVLAIIYELHLPEPTQTREIHDLLIWRLINL